MHSQRYFGEFLKAIILHKMISSFLAYLESTVLYLVSRGSWAKGMVWYSQERHGAMTAIMKAQIDWIPLSIGAVQPTQEKQWR